MDSPIFHFVFHAYRSWNSDHPDGYYQRAAQGVQAPHAGFAEQRNANAAESPVVLNRAAQEAAILLLPAICTEWGHDAVAAEATENHLHILAALGGGAAAELVHGRLKGRLSFELKKRGVMEGGKKFSRGGQPLRVRDERHLRQLLSHYLPEHDGVYWVAQRWQHLAPEWARR